MRIFIKISLITSFIFNSCSMDARFNRRPSRRSTRRSREGDDMDCPTEISDFNRVTNGEKPFLIIKPSLVVGRRG